MVLEAVAIFCLGLHLGYWVGRIRTQSQYGEHLNKLRKTLKGAKVNKYSDQELQEMEFIASNLYNDELSSDEELVDFLANEVSFSRSELERVVQSERTNFLCPKYSRHTTEDDKRVLSKYLTPKEEV